MASCCCFFCNLVPFVTFTIYTDRLMRIHIALNMETAGVSSCHFRHNTFACLSIFIPKIPELFSTLWGTYLFLGVLFGLCVCVISISVYVCVWVCVLYLLPWQHLCKSQRPNEILRFWLNYIIKLCLIWHATHFHHNDIFLRKTFSSRMLLLARHNNFCPKLT